MVLVLTLAISSVDLWKGYHRQLLAQRNPSPYTGQWHVDAATLDGKPHPVPTGDGLPMTDIFLEPTGRAMLRDSDTVLWRAGMHFDDKKHTATLYTEFADQPYAYTFAEPDAAHLLLTPTGKDAKATPALALTRVPLPSYYFLQERGFHFVNEWGLER